MAEQTVSVSLGATLNVGNFESVRFDYSLTDRVRNYETEDEAFDRVEQVVEARLQKRMKEERE